MTSSYNKTLRVQTSSLKWTTYKARNRENLNFQSFIFKISHFLASEFKLIEKKKKLWLPLRVMLQCIWDSPF